MSGAKTGQLRPLMAFTCRSSGRANVLTSEIQVFPAFQRSETPPKGIRCHAIYDTGATNSAITPEIVDTLALASIGNTIVGVGGGTLNTSSHLVNIALPNHVIFPMMRVAKT
ncbi:MAG TPA: hypothetical protein PKJ41_11990, partial [Bryobacteraceae bacterium]|nr:hypothetical protein [Bryobacteraceae bacterium]